MSEETLKKALFDNLYKFIECGFEHGIFLRLNRTKNIDDETTLKKVIDESFSYASKKSQNIGMFLDKSSQNQNYSSSNNYYYAPTIHIGGKSDESSGSIDLSDSIDNHFGNPFDRINSELLTMYYIGIYTEDYLIKVFNSFSEDILPAVKKYISLYSNGHYIDDRLEKFQNRFIIDFTNFLKMKFGNPDFFKKEIKNTKKKSGMWYRSGNFNNSQTNIRDYQLEFSTEITNKNIKKKIGEYTCEFLKSKNIHYVMNRFCWRNRNSAWFCLPETQFIEFTYDTTHSSYPISKMEIKMDINSWESIGMDPASQLLPSI